MSDVGPKADMPSLPCDVGCRGAKLTIYGYTP